MNEKRIKHPIHIDISMYNSNGVFTPSAYQRMIMGMIEEHLDELDLGEKKLMEKHGISWVLLSTSIEFERKMNPGEKIMGVTWHAGGRIPSYRRDFVFETENGTIVAKGATISTLFDNGTRKICLNKDKLSVVDLEPQEPILSSLERRMKVPSNIEMIECISVRPSMTDGVGHVNNTKYGDFVYDAMTRDERDNLSNLKRLDVWFNYELREGDKFEIYKARESDSTICFIGKRLGESKSSFDFKLTYFD